MKENLKGYSLFLCKEHATDIHYLEKDFRSKFLEEMSLVAEAVYKAFQPDKLNYELLGVGSGVHMHWHFFHRRAEDTPKPGLAIRGSRDLCCRNFKDKVLVRELLTDY